MREHLFISDMKSGMDIDDYYVLVRKAEKLTRNNDPYLTMILTDSSGRLDGVMWKESVAKWGTDFKKGQVVRVRGKIEEFNDKIQVNAERVGIADENNYDKKWFLPVAPVSVESIITQLKDNLALVKDENLKQLINMFMSNEDMFEQFTTAPGAVNLHHAYIGGLAHHTLGVMNLCIDMSNRYSALNRDLLIVSALFHDIGKISENSWDVGFTRTASGDLLGHIVQGLQIIKPMLDRVYFDEKTRLNLEHCIISHHGYFEYGSPKLPMTREALALHLADYADSHLDEYERMLEGIDEGESTNSIRFLDGRKLYNL
jgi:3'-5' exoribonuclease